MPLTIHLMWIINQSGQLIFQMNFTEPKATGELGTKPDSQLTMASVLFSTYSMSQELTPCGIPSESRGMTLIEMVEHAIHIYETPSMVKFVLVTDASSTQLPPQLMLSLHTLYVDHAAKNPFHTVDESGISQPIRIPSFTEAVKRVVRAYSPAVDPPVAAH